MSTKKLIAILEERLQVSPENIRLKEKLAGLLLNHGEFTRAEKLYSEVLKEKPTSKNAVWGLAKIYSRKQDFNSAINLLSRLSQLSNSHLNKEQSLLFAKLLAKSGDIQQSTKWFDQAVSFDSTLLQSEMEFWKFLKHANQIHRLTNQPQSGMSINGFTPKTNQIPVSLVNRQYVLFEISQFIPIVPIRIQQGMADQIIFEEELAEDFDDNDLIQSMEREEATEQDSDFVLDDRERVALTLEQVGGLFNPKKQFVKEILLPLSNPQLNAVYGINSNPKVLIYGPPGCGKSYLCKAFATESNVSFLSVRPTDFADLSFEQSEMHLESLLIEARKNKPAVIILDHGEWLASQSVNYESGSYIYKNNIFNNLLYSLGGKLKYNDHIGLILITNKPWLLNPDYFTTSKIDKYIYVAPPSFREKVDIFKTVLAERENPYINTQEVNALQVIHRIGRNIHSPAEFVALVEGVINFLIYQDISNWSPNSLITKLNLTTEHFINYFLKENGGISAIKLWMGEAKKQMGDSKSLMHPLWNHMQRTTDEN